MQNDLDLPVRQAGAIYLKNLITQNWQDRENDSGEPMVYSIHEQDRAMIRGSIVDAIVHAPDLIRYNFFFQCTSLHFVKYLISKQGTTFYLRKSYY